MPKLITNSQALHLQISRKLLPRRFQLHILKPKQPGAQADEVDLMGNGDKPKRPLYFHPMPAVQSDETSDKMDIGSPNIRSKEHPHSYLHEHDRCWLV